VTHLHALDQFLVEGRRQTANDDFIDLVFDFRHGQEPLIIDVKPEHRVIEAFFGARGFALTGKREQP